MLNKVSQDSTICKNIKYVLGLKYDNVKNKRLILTSCELANYISDERTTYTVTFISDDVYISRHDIDGYIIDNEHNIYVDISEKNDIRCMKTIIHYSMFVDKIYQIIYKALEETLLYSKVGGYYIIVPSRYISDSEYFKYDNTNLNLSIIDGL